MIKFVEYKGYKIEKNIGIGKNLPQEYRIVVYYNKIEKKIYSGDLLGNNSWEEGNTDRAICTVSHPHPYYGKPTKLTYDEIIAMVEDNLNYEEHMMEINAFH
jgi:hypothetical protein